MDKLVNVEARLDMIRYTSEIFYDECISESKKTRSKVNTDELIRKIRNHLAEYLVYFQFLYLLHLEEYSIVLYLNQLEHEVISSNKNHYYSYSERNKIPHYHDFFVDLYNLRMHNNLDAREYINESSYLNLIKDEANYFVVPIMMERNGLMNHKKKLGEVLKQLDNFIIDTNDLINTLKKEL